MKALVTLLGLAVCSQLIGCDVGCIEDGSGVHCTGKSLKEFVGARSAPQALDRAPGAPVNIDVQYGNVIVDRSASGKVEVEFAPFVYAGYDQDASAQAQLAQNLRTTATAAGAVTVTVARQGGSNGLGADVVVRLPDGFDGPLTILNRGDGPLNHFGIRVQSVGRASALTLTNQSLLGDCWVQGAPTVRSTTVQCGDGVSVFDVSDRVDITNRDDGHDDANPAVTLRLASVSPAGGGRVVSASGHVAVTLPHVGLVVNARSPVHGTVQEGALPAGCTKAETSPAQKTVTCGGGPTYEIIAGEKARSIGQPHDNNVLLSWR